MNLNFLRERGVRIFGEGVYVEENCEIESGAELYAPVHISGGSHICAGARVLPYSYISSSYVGVNTSVLSSTLIDSHVCADCSVGPYAYLRSGAYVEKGCRIGDFVEIKAARLGAGSKAAHLAYIGDADVGANVNIGCGVVFANYDGKCKRRTVVDDDCFIGCNSNLVAPVHLKRGAYVAAGTTVTVDLNEHDFCIGRVREKVKNGGGVGRYGNG